MSVNEITSTAITAHVLTSTGHIAVTALLATLVRSVRMKSTSVWVPPAKMEFAMT